MNKKEEDLKLINQHFESIKKSLDAYAKACGSLMPLVADNLLFTKKLVDLYQKAFNEGLK